MVGPPASTEKGVSRGNGFDQRVNVRLVVVNGKRCPCRGAHAQAAHERLGAVVAGAYADARLVKHLRDVVSMDVYVAEADDASPQCWVRRPVDHDVFTVVLLQGPQGVRRQRTLVCPYSSHAERF